MRKPSTFRRLSSNEYQFRENPTTYSPLIVNSNSNNI